jgi:hypothetical protein
VQSKDGAVAGENIAVKRDLQEKFRSSSNDFPLGGAQK